MPVNIHFTPKQGQVHHLWNHHLFMLWGLQEAEINGFPWNQCFRLHKESLSLLGFGAVPEISLLHALLPSVLWALVRKPQDSSTAFWSQNVTQARFPLAGRRVSSSGCGSKEQKIQKLGNDELPLPQSWVSGGLAYSTDRGRWAVQWLALLHITRGSSRLHEPCFCIGCLPCPYRGEQGVTELSCSGEKVLAPVWREKSAKYPSWREEFTAGLQCWSGPYRHVGQCL